MSLFCGIDWAPDHHDIAVVDHDGRKVASGRVENTASGFAALLAMRTDLPEHRPQSKDSELAQSVRVLARAQQDTIRTRQQVTNRIIALLQEFYPPQRWKPSPASRAASPDLMPG